MESSLPMHSEIAPQLKTLPSVVSKNVFNSVNDSYATKFSGGLS